MNQLEHKVILVTGANGFIGGHLVARLSKIAGVTLLLLSRQNWQPSQQDVVWLKGELKQLTSEYWQSHDISHIDYVFHLGAFIPKISAEANRIDRVVDDNILGTRALLQSLPGKPDKLVFSSTVDVYAQPENDEVLTEGSMVAPSALYGASKLFCESLISAWAKEVGCNFAILRYGHIYGPGEEQYGKLIPVVIRNLLANQAPVVHGNGSALRDYLYVGDAVDATIRAALVEGSVEPVNIVRGKSVSIKEIVQILIHLVGSNKEINFLSDKPNGNSLRFDNGLMTKLLGNWSMTSLEKGLAAEVEGFRRIKNERQ
jgi:nucleoside-diphosphate-sugar epimerase